MKEKPYEFGKEFAHFDGEVSQIKGGAWHGVVTIGATVYGTELYEEKDYAMSELKGYLEGLMVQMKKYVEYIDNELKKGE